MVITIFHLDICIKFTLSGRNDNISLDVCNFFMIKMLQLLCYFFNNIIGKPWQNMLHEKIIPPQQIQDTRRLKRKPSFGKFVTEMLIFRSSRSQMFFKISVLKNFAILEPFFNKVAGLLLQNTYGGCSWVFTAADTFFS